MRFVPRWLLAFSFMVALVAASTSFAATETPPWTAYTSPQQLVALPDGRRINLVCMGNGSPTVILEAGGTHHSSIWHAVQFKIAQKTRTCAYDRAGLGFSDEGPMPRDAAAVVADLHAMLGAAKVEGPYILVGHSIGSYSVRLFTDLYLDVVAGMVLLDPSGDYQAERFAAAVPALATSNTQPVRDDPCRAAGIAGRLKPGTGLYRSCIVSPAGLPAALAVAFNAPSTFPSRYRAADSEVGSMTASSAELAARKRSYGEMPLIVLTAGHQSLGPMFSEAEADAYRRAWHAMHDEMAGLSSKGQRRTVSDSRHMIQLERPQVVIDAVTEVITDVRRSAAGASRGRQDD